MLPSPSPQLSRSEILRSVSSRLTSTKSLPVVLQPKTSSALNSQKSRRKLAHQPSKIDLIDDTTLTSLPFAPPPPRKIRRSESALSDASKPSSGITENTLMPLASSTSSHDSFEAPLQDDDSTAGDLTMEEPEDPIVLVEDYLTDQTAESEVSQRLNRKKSLATFKQRYYSSGRARSATPPRTSKRALPDEEYLNYKQSAEDLEAIFGKLPGADGLKHCAFCNKPLYEISSIISSTCQLPPLSPDQNRAELYNEFVCWDCISVYEQFMSELDQTGALLKVQTKNESQHLVDILSSLCTKNATADIQPPKKQIKHVHSNHKFSPDLLGRLHYLSSVSEPSSGSSWLENLITKLK